MKKTIFICDKCMSENVSENKITYNVKQKKVQSYDLDYEWWETVSSDSRYDCICLECSHKFVEYDE